MNGWVGGRRGHKEKDGGEEDDSEKTCNHEPGRAPVDWKQCKPLRETVRERYGGGMEGDMEEEWERYGGGKGEGRWWEVRIETCRQYLSYKISHTEHTNKYDGCPVPKLAVLDL